jgi:hypothetical protein
MPVVGAGLGGQRSITAVAPDVGETVQSQLNKYPTDVFTHIEVADGRVWMLPEEGIKCFAGDLPEREQKVLCATHYAPAADLFEKKLDGAAWKSKPSWFIVAKNDRTVHPDLQRSWQSVWGRPPSRQTAATSSCSPSLTLSLTRSARLQAERCLRQRSAPRQY